MMQSNRCGKLRSQKWGLAWALLAAAAVCAAASSGATEATACKRAKHPIVILPGIMASDLDVHVSTASNTPSTRGPASWRPPCVARRQPARLSVWPPLPNLLTNMACFSYLMVPVPCMRGGRLSLCDQPGVDMRVNAGGRDGTDALTFRKGGYAQLTEFLVQEFGYRLGHDLFAAPYDWRLSLDALDDRGYYDSIAERVAGAVAANCGKRALLLGHSMGSLVALGMLRSARLAEWRQENVEGFVALAPPLGGSTYAIASKLGGNHVNLLDALGDLLQPIIQELYYQGSRGLPSMLMLMPYPGLWGHDYVLVSTPTKNYTLGELAGLFRAMGDEQSAALYSSYHNLDELVQQGPVPGVQTHCIYGAGMPTVQAWHYGSIVPGRPAPPGTALPAAQGLGDGVVNVESMRLCTRLTSASNVHELGPGVTHGGVLSHPSSLAALAQVLQQLLAPHGGAGNATTAAVPAAAGAAAAAAAAPPRAAAKRAAAGAAGGPAARARASKQRG